MTNEEFAKHVSDLGCAAALNNDPVQVRALIDDFNDETTKHLAATLLSSLSSAHSFNRISEYVMNCFDEDSAKNVLFTLVTNSLGRERIW